MKVLVMKLSAPQSGYAGEYQSQGYMILSVFFVRKSSF